MKWSVNKSLYEQLYECGVLSVLFFHCVGLVSGAIKSTVILFLDGALATLSRLCLPGLFQFDYVISTELENFMAPNFYIIYMTHSVALTSVRIE